MQDPKKPFMSSSQGYKELSQGNGFNFTCALLESLTPRPLESFLNNLFLFQFGDLFLGIPRFFEYFFRMLSQ